MKNFNKSIIDDNLLILQPILDLLNILKQEFIILDQLQGSHVSILLDDIVVVVEHLSCEDDEHRQGGLLLKFDFPLKKDYHSLIAGSLHLEEAGYPLDGEVVAGLQYESCWDVEIEFGGNFERESDCVDHSLEVFLGKEFVVFCVDLVDVVYVELLENRYLNDLLFVDV